LTDQTKKEAWVELKEAIGACSSCVLKNNCTQVKTHIKHCYKAKYRFRCPIEVLDTKKEVK